MQPFSSKELYMMNGGNKLYIYKDGFGDVYQASVAEEMEWGKEVVANALAGIDTIENQTSLKAAIENLVFHKYEGLEALLVKKIKNTSPARQIVFATMLWNISKSPDSFPIVYEIFLKHRDTSLNEVFWAMNELKKNAAAGYFLISCLEGDDSALSVKAHTAITMWAYTGLPELRENNLLELIQPENKSTASFKEAIERLKEILLNKN